MVCVHLVLFGNLTVVRHKGRRIVKLFFGSPDLSDAPWWPVHRVMFGIHFGCHLLGLLPLSWGQRDVRWVACFKVRRWRMLNACFQGKGWPPKSLAARGNPKVGVPFASPSEMDVVSGGNKEHLCFRWTVWILDRSRGDRNLLLTVDCKV